MSKSYKLLIADDEFNTRELLGRYLRRRYDVDTAMDGVEAIKKLESTDEVCQQVKRRLHAHPWR